MELALCCSLQESICAWQAHTECSVAVVGILSPSVHPQDRDFQIVSIFKYFWNLNALLRRQTVSKSLHFLDFQFHLLLSSREDWGCVVTKRKCSQRWKMLYSLVKQTDGSTSAQRVLSMRFRIATVSSSGVPVHIIFFSNTELSWSAP